MIEKEKLEEILRKHNLGDKNITSVQDLFDTVMSDFSVKTDSDIKFDKSKLEVLLNYIGALKDIIVSKVDSEVSDGAKKLLFKLKSIQRIIQNQGKPKEATPESPKPETCPYCHRRDEGRESQEAIINDSDLTVQVEVDTPIGLRRNDGGVMSILHGPKKVSQIHIYYCPMCGRKLNEPKD